MHITDTAAQAQAERILSSANELTLATFRADGGPHATTVNFAADCLTTYAAIAIDSEKAHELYHDPRVATTVNLPYDDWTRIEGLSIRGTASFVTSVDQLQRVAALLLHKPPQYRSVITRTDMLPWPRQLFVRIEPSWLSIIDYSRGFGHAAHHELDAVES